MSESKQDDLREAIAEVFCGFSKPDHIVGPATQSIWQNALAKADGALALIQRQRAVPAVKALEWRDHGPDSFPARTWSAATPFGFYEIEEESASDSPRYRLEWHSHRFIADDESLDGAKAAAQADYHQRILSVLAAPPAPAEAAGENDEDMRLDHFYENDEHGRLIRVDLPVAAPAAEAPQIVPEQCTHATLSFEPGLLTVAKDGSAALQFDEDDVEFMPRDDRDGANVTMKLAASEVQAIRRFLNGLPAAASPAEPDVVRELVGTINPTTAEVQCGHDRQAWAEGLILQLPETHDGRNSWLLNFGTGADAQALREKRSLDFDERTRAAHYHEERP